MEASMLFNPAILEQRLATIEAQNRELLKLLNAKKYVTQKEIAKSQGVAVYTLLREPWRLPNYGMADVGSRPKKWFLETVQVWDETPFEVRKSRWFAMSPEERNQYLKVKD